MKYQRFFDEEGAVALLEEYYLTLERDIDEPPHECLACGEDSVGLKRCGKCLRECRKVANRLHRYDCEPDE